MSYYILNTNKKLNPNGTDEKTMLREQIAAAYCHGWKEEIEKLKQGDVVFLYRVKEGIIAYGVVTGGLHKRDYRGVKDEEFYKNLKSFHILDTPISAKTIRRLANGKVAFLKAMFQVNATVGEAILEKFGEEVFVAKAA